MKRNRESSEVRKITVIWKWPLSAIILRQERLAGRVRAEDESKILCSGAARPRISVLQLPSAKDFTRMNEIILCYRFVDCSYCCVTDRLFSHITLQENRRSKQRLVSRETLGEERRRVETDQFLFMRTPCYRSSQNRDRDCHGVGGPKLL